MWAFLNGVRCSMDTAFGAPNRTSNCARYPPGLRCLLTSRHSLAVWTAMACSVRFRRTRLPTSCLHTLARQRTNSAAAELVERYSGAVRITRECLGGFGLLRMKCLCRLIEHNGSGLRRESDSLRNYDTYREIYL